MTTLLTIFKVILLTILPIGPVCATLHEPFDDVLELDPSLSQVTIPCRGTSEKVKVHLEDESGKVIRRANGREVFYDPELGLTVTQPDWFAWHNMKCVFRLNDKVESKNITLIWIAEYLPPLPSAVKMSNTQEPTFVCTHVDTLRTNFQLRWFLNGEPVYSVKDQILVDSVDKGSFKISLLRVIELDLLTGSLLCKAVYKDIKVTAVAEVGVDGGK